MALESGGMKCIKFLLFLFNFIFVISGLIILAVGVLIQVRIRLEDTLWNCS